MGHFHTCPCQINTLTKSPISHHSNILSNISNTHTWSITRYCTLKMTRTDTSVSKTQISICKPEIVNGKSFQVIHRPWVKPEYRNRGYMKAMVYGIYSQGVDDMMSDQSLSPQSRCIWTELCRVRCGKMTNSPDVRFFLERPTIDWAKTKFAKPLGGPPMMHLHGYQYFIDNRYLDIHPKTSK